MIAKIIIIFRRPTWKCLGETIKLCQLVLMMQIKNITNRYSRVRWPRFLYTPLQHNKILYFLMDEAYHLQRLPRRFGLERHLSSWKWLLYPQLSDLGCPLLLPFWIYCVVGFQWRLVFPYNKYGKIVSCFITNETKRLQNSLEISVRVLYWKLATLIVYN